MEKDGGHTYVVHKDADTITLPSVTTIVNFVVNKPALQPWAYGVGIKETLNYLSDLPIDLNKGLPTTGEVKIELERRKRTFTDDMKRGGERGSATHKVLESVINEDEDYTYSVEFKPYIDTLLKAIDEYELEFLESEFKVASLEDGFAGTLDAICIPHRHPPRRKHKDITGKRTLLDIKTNKWGAVYIETHLPQVEAYAKAYHEMGGDPVDEKLVLGLGPDGKFGACVSYARYQGFKLIHDVYNEQLWTKANNPNKRK